TPTSLVSILSYTTLFRSELLVQRSGAFGDLAGILALAFLAPQAVDDPQRGQQRGRADDDDVLLVGLLEQSRIGLQRGGERRLDRSEEQTAELQSRENRVC